MNQKVGLDYFSVNCVTDEEIKLVTAEFGMRAFAIIIKLFQKIYGGNGYYCDWNEEVCLLFIQENGLGGKYVSSINEIVLCCMRRGVFSKAQYEKNHILTSEKIQMNFLDATKRRKSVKMKKAYLLVKVAHLPENVDIIHENDNILKENDNTLKQSRVKKSNNSLSLSEIPTIDEIYKHTTENGIKTDVKKFYSFYQRKGWVDSHGILITDWKAALDYWLLWEKNNNMNRDGGTNGGVQKSNSRTQFNHFSQRNISDTEMDELEKFLLNK